MYLDHGRATEVEILTDLGQYHHKNIVELLYLFSQNYPENKVYYFFHDFYSH